MKPPAARCRCGSETSRRGCPYFVLAKVHCGVVAGIRDTENSIVQSPTLQSYNVCRRTSREHPKKRQKLLSRRTIGILFLGASGALPRTARSDCGESDVQHVSQGAGRRTEYAMLAEEEGLVWSSVMFQSPDACGSHPVQTWPGLESTHSVNRALRPPQAPFPHSTRSVRTQA